MMNAGARTKLIAGMLIGAGSTLLALLLWLATPVLPGWENSTWTWRTKLLAKPSPATREIKLILIDQYSLDWASSQLALSWPWPREVYGPLLDFCRRGGAKVIAFDMLYTEPSSYLAADDVLFGEAIARSNDVVMALFMGEQAGQATSWPVGVTRPPLVVEHLEAYPQLAPVEPGAALPVPAVASAATLLANVKDVPDADGVFRRVTPLRMFDGVPVPLLGLGAYLVAEASSPFVMRVDDTGLRIGARVVPLSDDGRALLRFRGPSGTHEAFTAAAVIQSELLLREGGAPVIDPEELRGAYVFVGVSAPGLKDARATPVSGDYPGVELHATFLDNLLAQDFMREVPPGWLVAGTLVLAVAAALLILMSRSVVTGLLGGALMLVIPVGAGLLLFPAGWWWPIVPQALAALVAVGVAEIVNYSTEGRQKRFIKGAFRHYLSGEVIEQMLRDPSQLKLGGEKRELTIFFSDLQGFSAISEKLGPEALTALLNDYLTDMSDIIMAEGGTVDKYEGDAIIAFWNAPLAQADHAARACRAALRCQRKLAERRAEFLTRTGVDLFMRIGMHTGDVVVGNMGSHTRFNYTVLGDAANLASRLEGANKAFGTYLMISGDTWRLAREAGFHAREMGRILVVGRKAPVPVFELRGLPDEPPPEGAAQWTMAMNAIAARQWREAEDLFRAFGDDSLAAKYLALCAEMNGNTEKSWDGLWKLTEK